MIQKAHVGVGISGMEGLQAATASDYAIAQVNLFCLSYECDLKDLLNFNGFVVSFSGKITVRSRSLELRSDVQANLLQLLQKHLFVHY